MSAAAEGPAQASSRRVGGRTGQGPAPLVAPTAQALQLPLDLLTGSRGAPLEGLSEPTDPDPALEGGVLEGGVLDGGVLDGGVLDTRVLEGGVPDREVEVRRSTRRRRTVTAYREGERIVVLVPARMSRAEVERWVATMVDRLAAKEARRRPSDAALATRARQLSERYLDGRAVPSSVRWSTTQQRRWGSCTPADGTIRLSARLQGMPEWVVDYVLVHELTHLLVADHSPAFWSLVDRYPRAESAKGFLLGLAHAEAAGQPAADQLGEAGTTAC